MQRWQRIRFLSTVVLFVSLLGMIWNSSSPIQAFGLAMLVIIGVVGIFFSIKIEQKHWQLANQRQMIDLISHYRHDWMNDIQLLFGYISLKKYDKLDDCMDKIRTKVLQESCTAKLGIPSLVAFFISFRLYYHALTLELEMEQDINLASLPIEHEKVSRFVQRTIQLFNAHAEPSDEISNELSVQFDLESDALLFDLIYQGGCNEKALQQGIKAMMDSVTARFATIEEEYTVNKAVLTIRLPFLQ
jgi:stage 0 sporulation protein B (sporulation initiation phosphotransferase)